MKKSVLWICVAVLACGPTWSQINEKDTTATTVTARSFSIYLRADILPDFIQLQWSKGPDDLTGYFELYRSADGIAYNIVKQFHPETFGNTADHFMYKDEDPLRGKNYYRLIAYNRSTQEKKTVELTAVYKNQSRKLKPSLVSKGKELNILNYDGEELHLVVYTTGGTPLLQKVVSSSVVYLGTSKLSSGTYIYQLMDRRKYLVNSGKFMIL
jgi:hypothetical protein